MLAGFRKANPLRSAPAGRDFAAGFRFAVCAFGVHNHKQSVKALPTPHRVNLFQNVPRDRGAYFCEATCRAIVFQAPSQASRIMSRLFPGETGCPCSFSGATDFMAG